MQRREFIRYASTVAAAMLLKGFRVQAAAPAYFTHGIASGDPLADRVMLWTRVVPGDLQKRPLRCQWEIASDESFATIVARGHVSTSSEQDYTVKIDAIGLLPGKNYCYRFIAEGVVSATGRTRTLPVGAVDAFRLGVCSCANYPQGLFHAYRELAEADIDLVVHLGDYIYEYPVGFYDSTYARQQLGRNIEPEGELLVLEDYRARYGVYRTDPDLQAVHAAHPFVCVWDDHEIANDTWRDGAQNHNPGEGDFHSRMRAARKAYCEWLPIRAQPEQPIFRRLPIGDLADIMMLDTRLHGRDRGLNYGAGSLARSDVAAFRQALSDPRRTLLGYDQEGWLTQCLQASAARGATWQVLGQQVLVGSVTMPVIPDGAFDLDNASGFARNYVATMQQMATHGLPLNTDAWDGYPAARSRLFDDLKSIARNPVVLAGDTHNAWAFDLLDDAGQPLAVEIGTPSINSSGYEGFVSLPVEVWERALLAANPGIRALDMQHRGWTSITLRPEQMESQWHFVSDVLKPDYRSWSAPELVCRVGARHLTNT